MNLSALNISSTGGIGRDREMEGFMYKANLSSNKWNRLWFNLDARGELTYFSNSNADYVNPNKVLLLKDTKLVYGSSPNISTAPPTPYCFQLKTAQKIISFCCETEAEMEDWCRLMGLYTHTSTPLPRHDHDGNAVAVPEVPADNNEGDANADADFEKIELLFQTTKDELVQTIKLPTKRRELDTITVAELKKRLCLLLNSAGQIKPETIDLFICGATVRDHWTGALYGLNRFTVFDVYMKNGGSKPEADPGNGNGHIFPHMPKLVRNTNISDQMVQTDFALDGYSEGLLFRLDVRLHPTDTTTIPLDVHIEDSPRELIESFLHEHQLDYELLHPLLHQVYKRLSEIYLHECQHCKMDINQLSSSLEVAQAKLIQFDNTRRLAEMYKRQLEAAQSEITQLREEPKPQTS